MGELGGFSGNDVIARLRRAGYVIVRQRGSHVRLRADGKRLITVPRHKELGIGILKQIINDADMTVEEFLEKN